MSSYKALYRKWRPYDFDDVCGQNAITDILKYEVANNKTSHAYLFCGSRGTGKTSCAKILAKAVNCLNPRSGNPCNECEACRSIDKGIATDVIEMDAASNNGVDNVRDMKDEIAFTPAELKYRVYIIDEVHMMTGPAFNALLKTLEEPPAYVIFILATTEFNKLPTTIVSRCQRFDFRRISSDVICQRLKRISKSEGIDLTDEGALVLARAARGGMRDAVSLLELCAGAKKTIDSRLVSNTIGSGNRDNVYSIVEAICKTDYDTVYKTVNEICMISSDISVFWQEIIDTYRDMMVVKNSRAAKSYLDLTEREYERLLSLSKEFTMAKMAYHVRLLEDALADMQRAQNAKRGIAEITLTRMCDPTTVSSPEALTLRIEELEREMKIYKIGALQITNDSAVSISEVSNNTPEASVAKSVAPIKEQKSEASLNSQEIVENVNKTSQKTAKAEKNAYNAFSGWSNVLEGLSTLKPALAAQLRDSVALTDGNGNFVVKMSPAFLNTLSKNIPSVMLIKSGIAEQLRRPANEINITFEKNIKETASELQRELEDALK